MLNLSFVNPNCSTYTECNAYCEFSRHRPLKVKLCIWYCLIDHWLCCRLLKQQNIITMMCPPNWHIAFGDSYIPTINNKLWLNQSNFKCYHSPWFRLCPSKFRKFYTRLRILRHEVTSHMIQLDAQRTTIDVVICRGNHDQFISQYSICRTLRVS